MACASAARMSAMRPQEAVAIAPPAHAGQERAGHMLEGEVEVRHTGAEHRLDQLVGEPGRVEVEQPGALDPGRDGPGQRGDGRRTGLRPLTGTRAVPPVGRQVLGHQHDLAHRRRGLPGRRGPAGQELVDLGHDLVHLAGALLAPEGRDGAEAADAVAPLGHLHVGPGDLGRRAGQLEQIEPARPAGGRACGQSTGRRRRDAPAGSAKSIPNPATRSTSGRASVSSLP